MGFYYSNLGLLHSNTFENMFVCACDSTWMSGYIAMLDEISFIVVRSFYLWPQYDTVDARCHIFLFSANEKVLKKIIIPLNARAK